MIQLCRDEAADPVSAGGAGGGQPGHRHDVHSVRVGQGEPGGPDAEPQAGSRCGQYGSSL